LRIEENQLHFDNSMFFLIWAKIGYFVPWYVSISNFSILLGQLFCVCNVSNLLFIAQLELGFNMDFKEIQSMPKVVSKFIKSSAVELA